jgi:hypothetical protein
VDVFRRLEGKFGRFVSIWHPDLPHLDVHRACYFFAYACVPERRVIALLVSRQDFYPPTSVEVLAHIGRRAV